MSRRSEPSPLPLLRRDAEGNHYVGEHPTFRCSWCEVFYDRAAFESCPVCAHEIAEIERRWRDDLRQWALEVTPPITPTIQ